MISVTTASMIFKIEEYDPHPPSVRRWRYEGIVIPRTVALVCRKLKTW